MGTELLLRNHWRLEVAVTYGVVVRKSSLGSLQFYKSLSIPEDRITLYFKAAWEARGVEDYEMSEEDKEPNEAEVQRYGWRRSGVLINELIMSTHAL